MGLVEFSAQQPLLDVLGLNNFAAGDLRQLRSIALASSDASGFRIKSVFTHPIIYGQMMALMTPMALHLIIHDQRWRRWLGVALLPGIAISLVLCQARSPFVVLVVVTVLYLAIYSFDVRKGSRLVMFVLLTVGAVALAPLAIERTEALVLGTSSREAGSTAVRESQWSYGRNAMSARPLLGYGSGQAPIYAGVVGRNEIRSVDSYPLTIWVESGAIGLLLYVSMMGAFFGRGLLLAISEPNRWRRSVLAVLTASVVGSFVGLTIVSIDDSLSFAYLAAGFFVAESGLRWRRALAGVQDSRPAQAPVGALENRASTSRPMSRAGDLRR
jgi:O-antigen ligase